MKLKVNKDESDIWGIELASENKQDEYFIKKTIAEGSLHYSSETSGGIKVGLSLPSLAELRLLTLDVKERINLAYILGITDTTITRKVPSVRQAVFDDPERVEQEETYKPFRLRFRPMESTSKGYPICEHCEKETSLLVISQAVAKGVRDVGIFACKTCHPEAFAELDRLSGDHQP